MDQDKQKEQHLKDGNKALLELKDDTQIGDQEREFREKSLNEFLTLIETGSNSHINTQEEEKKPKPEHFK